MAPNTIGLIIILISTLVGYYFYSKNMLFGETKPNLVSWFIWMLAPFLGFFFAFKAGAGLSNLPVFIAGLGPLIVLLISVFKKNGYWKINSFDLVCGLFSLIALVLYAFTKNLSISILFVIIADGLAGMPTIIKAWNFPKSETSILYASGTLNQVVGLLAIKNWIFPIYSLNIYFILINLAIILSIYRKKITPIFS